MTASPLVLSIVSPVFEATPNLAELVRRVTAAVAPLTAEFEIILVDDGSQDDSWQEIATAAARDSRVKGVRLSRNFGQTRAIGAGLDHAAGAYVVVMDCDLQDDPAHIPQLMKKAREGFDIVLTHRQREQSWSRRLLAAVFFQVYDLLADEPVEDPGLGGYSLLSRPVAETVRQVPNKNANYLATVMRLGGRRTILPVVAGARFAGQSSYSVFRLFQIALNVLVGCSVSEAKAKGYSLVSYCSSHATVLTDKPLGENCFVLEGSILQPFCRLGRNVSVWGGTIGHHSLVGDNCYTAGYLAGGVQLGSNCFVGLNAVLRTQITVGESSVIGIGAVVTKSVPAFSVVTGPAAQRSAVPSNRLPRL